MRQAKPITRQFIEACRKDYESDLKYRTLTCAVSKAELPDAAFNGEAARKLDMTFSIDLCRSAVTWQKSSGRCWIFAAMNILREAAAENCGMERIELSENYIAFWDKFEKINYFLEAVIDCGSLPVGDRTLDWVLQGISDGGQWDMIVSIVKKYGVVPVSAMPETSQSSSTKVMNRMLNMKLREYAAELRAMVSRNQDPQARKEEMLKEMYRALCICFGKPAETFDFEYRDKDDHFHRDVNLTPYDFYDRYVKIDLEDYVSIINAPTADKPYGRAYTVKYLGNVVEDPVRHINVPMETLKQMVISQLKDGEPVWFGCDCSRFGDRKLGIWDQDSFCYGEILGGLTFGMTKEERLDYRDSAMNHAMVIAGVNLDENGVPNRWKIENSWGEEAGQKGYFVMSSSWFDEFTYQAVVHKKYLPDDLKKALSEEPEELEPWDPMGSLA